MVYLSLSQYTAELYQSRKRLEREKETIQSYALTIQLINFKKNFTIYLNSYFDSFHRPTSQAINVCMYVTNTNRIE